MLITCYDIFSLRGATKKRERELRNFMDVYLPLLVHLFIVNHEESCSPSNINPNRKESLV